MIAHPRFPVCVLDGVDSAICVFSAAFDGYNCEAHVSAAGLTDVTLVDNDADALAHMSTSYPRSWRYIAADAFEWVRAPHDPADLVTLDPWASLAPRVMDDLPLFAALARVRLVVDVPVVWLASNDVDSVLPGWRATVHHASTMQSWVVWER